MQKNDKSIHTIILAMLLACSMVVSDRNGFPGYTDEPKKFGSINLGLGDTNSAEYRQMVGKLDSFYKIQVARGFNGSVLIGYQGQVLYERYFGYADKNEGRKLAPDAAVQLASTSKTFTATAVMYLHQHKYLNINHKVQTYLPSFPYPDVTIKTLLNHRSGIPNYLNWDRTYVKNGITPIYNDELLALISKHKPRLEFT